jgi:hypothetical protein
MYHQDFEIRTGAINDIIKYVELDYNEKRLAKHCFATTQGKSCAHSKTRIKKGLDYRSPRQMWFSYYS